MPDRAWKKTERIVAQRLGGVRLPVNGRGNQPDVRHPWLAIEVKHRRTLPRWLKDGVIQARRAAASASIGQQLPIVVLHEHGSPHADDLVVLRLDDFEAWLGNATNDTLGKGE